MLSTVVIAPAILFLTKRDALHHPDRIASAVLTFAALVAIAGIIAAFLAYRYGGQSRARRRAIFTLVGAAGMLAAAAVAFARLHAPVGA